MSIKLDHKRSLSEMNFKSKVEKKSLTSSVNNNTKNSTKKLSLTPNKKILFDEKDNKKPNDRKSNDLKKSLMLSQNNNPFIKKSVVKKNEIMIHDDTTFSSKKSEKNTNPKENPISHRINTKNNYFPVDVNISDLANFSIDKLKKMSDNILKKTPSSNNLSSLTQREKKTSINENLSASTSKNKITPSTNNNKNKSTSILQPGKKLDIKDLNEKEYNYERNSKSNNKVLKSNDEYNKSNLKNTNSNILRSTVNQQVDDNKKRSNSPLIQSFNLKGMIPNGKKDNFSNMNSKPKIINSDLNSKKNDFDQKKTFEIVEVTNNLNPRGNFPPRKRTDVVLTDEKSISVKTNDSSKNIPLKKLDFKELNTSPLLRCKKSNDSEETLMLQIKNNAVLQNIIKNQKRDVLKQELSNQKINTNPLQSSTNIIASQRNLVVKKTIKTIKELTKTGFDGYAQKKNNQDSFFIYSNFMGNSDSYYIGVCDGHGVVGHDVSGYLKSNLPYNEIKKHSKNKELNTIITDTFIDMNNKIVNSKQIDSQFRYFVFNCSGSTCVTLIYTPEKLICANVGDSRAVIGRCEHGKKDWKSFDLSRDHKPSDEDEAERIRSKKGRIEPFKDENNEFIGPSRVWLMDEDIPGLAMSRSFGDEVAASVGVSSHPEIKEYIFNKNDAFFIIASDGIWEFITSDECINIIKDYYLKNDCIGACEHLVKESSKRWMKEEEVIDDITLIIVFLN